MIELLCVMAIIGILAALLLPAVMNAYLRIKGAAEEFEGPTIAGMLEHECRNYCAANATYHFDSKEDFVQKVRCAPKCQNWVEASRTVFVPFTNLDPTNLVVISVYIGPRYRTLYAFTKGDLSIRP
jgi:Tfp pilus assembly protein PilE